MPFEEILYEVADGVATVTLNRPAKLNAWTFKMQGEVEAAMAQAEKDKSGLSSSPAPAGRFVPAWTCRA
jgi:enoyl-CoA hydratase/carnithine racemase